jgi:hypothetical protein
MISSFFLVGFLTSSLMLLVFTFHVAFIKDDDDVERDDAIKFF